MFKSKQFIIGVVISLLFLAWALSKEDLGAVWGAIVHANYWVLLPALVLYFIGVWVRAVRWKILLRPIAPKIPLLDTFEVVVIGYMANDVLPARIGELVRAYVLGVRENIRKTATLATIVVERIFDGLVLVGFAAAVFLVVTTTQTGSISSSPGHRLGSILSQQSALIAIASIGFLVALIIFVVLASSRTRIEGVVNVALRFLPHRLRITAGHLAASFIDGLGALRSSTAMAQVFGLTVVAWLFEASMYYLLGNWGFNLVGLDGKPLPFYAYMLATSFANLSSLIPQAPGYIGVFDAIAKVVLVGAFGVNSTEATSYVLVLHASLLLPITILGFIYLWRESMSWRDLTGLEKSRVQAAQAAHEFEGPLTDIDLVAEGRIEELNASDEMTAPQNGAPAEPRPERRTAP